MTHNIAKVIPREVSKNPVIGDYVLYYHTAYLIVAKQGNRGMKLTLFNREYGVTPNPVHVDSIIRTDGYADMIEYNDFWFLRTDEGNIIDLCTHRPLRWTDDIDKFKAIMNAEM